MKRKDYSISNLISFQMVGSFTFLMNHPEEIARMGEINRQKASQRTWPAYAQRFTELYQEVLSLRGVNP